MRVSFVTMPYKDPEKRREFLKRWRDKNRERLNVKRRKGWRERKRLRVVLTPLTRVECQVYLDRLQRRKAATRDVECKACADRVRERAEAKRRKLERAREWKKANPEKVREHKRKWREKNREKLREQKQANREKVREHKRKWRQANREKVKAQKKRWQDANPEKVKAQKKRWRDANLEKVVTQNKRGREKEKVRQEGDEERARAVKEKVREQKRRYREANREKLRERKRRWRKNNPEKARAQREREKRARKDGDEESKRKRRERQQRYRQSLLERSKEERERIRETINTQDRLYHEAHKQECNRAKRERYYKQKGRPVPPPPPPPPPPPCDCGACLACGGWGASWKPTWHARLNAFSAKNDPPPAVTLEELPLDLLESETETLSIASTLEIDSELGDRLDALLADESDSEGETVDKVEAPTRRSDRIATMPAVSYQDWEEENPMWEFLKRKAQLHAEGEDRIVTQWELLSQRTERVDAIVEEMSMGVDPTRQLDRFHSQMERQDCVLDVMVSEELLDFVDDQLWEPFGETMNV